jgi:hypothetical protein
MKLLHQCGFICIALACLPASAADVVPRAEVEVATPDTIWVGQAVTIRVKLLTPGIFASAAAFDLPQVPGLVVVPPAGSPVVGSETIDDETYTTQLHELMALPQRAGDYSVPPFAIRFDSTETFGKPTRAEQVTTSPVSFTARLPPGAEGLSFLLTTTQLKVTETWQPDLNEKPVAAGTAFTRTVQVDADGLPGMLLPSFALNPPDGLRFYAHSPVVNDHSERGVLTGHRTEVSTLVCERSGDYELPAMTVSWWNPQDERLNHIELQGHSFTVTADPQTAESAKTHRTRSRILAITLLFVIAAAISGWRLAPGIRGWWKARQTARATSENELFHFLINACHSRDAHTTYRAFLAWRDSLTKALGGEAEWKHAEMQWGPSFTQEVTRLESAAYGVRTPATTGWSPEELEVALSKAHHAWHRVSWLPNRMTKRKLPMLNS